MLSVKEFLMLRESTEKVSFEKAGQGTRDLTVTQKETVDGTTILMIQDNGREYFVAVVAKGVDLRKTLKASHDGVSITGTAGSGRVKKMFKKAVEAAKTTKDTLEIAKAASK